MINSAKEAKILYKRIGYGTSWEVLLAREARGYLSALNGPEVQDLVKALEKSKTLLHNLDGDMAFGDPGKPVGKGNTVREVRVDVYSALAQFREAADGGVDVTRGEQARTSGL